MRKEPIKVLLIEDNPGDARLIGEMFADGKGLPCTLERADSLAAGIRRIARGDVDVVLLDLGLPDSVGIETLRSLLAEARPLPTIVVMSGVGDEEVGVQAVQEGAQDYLVKGHVDGGLLVRSIRYALERSEAEQALRQAQIELEHIVQERTARLAEAVRALEQDIAERKRVEQALRASEQKYRRIVETSGEGIIAIDRHEDITFINPRMAELLGYRPEELLGCPVRELMIQEERADHDERMRRRRTGQPDHYERRFYRKDGDEIVVLTNATPLMDDSGQFHGSFAMFTDITENKRAEEALRWELAVNRALSELSRALMSPASDIGTIARLTLDHARQLTGSEHGCVATVDPDTHDVIIHAMTSVMDEECQVSGENRHTEFPLGPGNGCLQLWGRSLDTRRPFYTNSPAAPETSGGAPAEHSPLQRFLSVPAVLGDRLLGQVAVANADRDYTSRELDAVRRLTELYVLALDRKRVEYALRESERRFEQVAENAQEWIWETNREGLYTFASPAVKQILGYEPEEIIGKKHFYDLFHPEDREKCRQAALGAFAEKRSFREFANRNIHKNGTEVWLSTSAVPMLDESGRLLGYRGADTDITERMRAEEQRMAHVRFLENLERIECAIRSAEDVDQMLRDVLETARRIFDTDRAWLFYPCDPEASTFTVPVLCAAPQFPIAPELLQTQPMTPDTAAVLRAVLASEKPICHNPESGAVLPDSATRFGVQSQIQMAVHPRVDSPWVFGLHQCSYARIWTASEEQLFREIGRRLADGLSSMLFLRDLRASEERFRNLVTQAADAFFLHDYEGRILDVNEIACDSLGFSRQELLAMNIADIDVEVESQRHKERFWKALRPDNPVTFEGMHRRKDGSTFPVEVRLGVMELGEQQLMLGLVRDITQRKQLESQLLQSQKMEAVGQLAGGVAHDFNNILTAILGNSELALTRLAEALPAMDPSVDCLQQIERSALRAADLTRQLLAFSRRQVVQPRIVNVREMLVPMEKMLRRLLTENISLEMKGEGFSWPVRIDPGQFEQVVMNLVVNARDAMPDGGILTLEIQNTNLDDEYVHAHTEARPGPHVMLVVSDTGCGMDAKVIGRIFEPFFTTKSVSQGTGLGLAMVYGIVKQAGGHIQVYSEPGHGSTLKVYLPAVLDAAETPRTAETAERPRGGTETILLCEDDLAVRQLTALMLKGAGYHVLCAENGARALLLSAEHPGPIQLLITDVIMPDTNGKKLADEVMAARPDLRVLYISGYTSNVIAHHGVLNEGIEFLEKPFTRRSLLKRVREVLESGHTVPAACAEVNSPAR
ncbi:MAG: PAS domain S-box protein [Phycisphaerae bacterium]|nr:PAS domain S-box protein [Phycisphaerae bacterium]